MERYLTGIKKKASRVTLKYLIFYQAPMLNCFITHERKFPVAKASYSNIEYSNWLLYYSGQLRKASITSI